MSKAPRNTNQFNSSTKVLAAVVCLALLLSTTPLVTAHNGKSESWNWPGLFSQGHQNGPRREAPEGVFPNLDEMRRTTDDRRRYGVDEPSIPDPIPSTRRRWRHGSQVAQPSSSVEVDFNALLAFASPPSDTGIPWLTSLESASISNPPFGLSLFSAKGYAPDHKASAETAGVGASLALSPQSASNFAMARLAPQNRTGTPGVDLLSKNFNWSLGLIGLRGRSGLDLGLSLAYNSKVWTKWENYIDFDLDEGTPAPGFRLGFPVVQGLFYNDQAGAYFYMLITPAGQRIELRRLGTTNVYQTVDATYAQLTDYGSHFIFRADGAQLKFLPTSGEYRCTEVKDRNGNYLTIAYNSSGDISTVTDTLARVLTFSYDGNSNLLKITQVWGFKSRSWATFGYGARYVGNNFPSLISYGPIDTYINVLTQVGLPDGSRYNFEYNYYGIVSEIRHHGADIDHHERRRTTYNLDGSSTDCPRVIAQREWAENWNGDVNGTYEANEEVVTNFGVDGSACTMTLPNGVIHKQFYGTGWQAGLTTQTETWSAGVRRKWTTYAWTQDNTGVNYLLNPRLIETNVNDVEGNLRRTTIDYGPYQQYSLPYLVREYTGTDGNTPIRDTYTHYHLSQAYLDRRIIGLVSATHVSDTISWQTKTTYDYDDPTKIEGLPSAPTRHDSSFNTSFLTRGNLTSVSRWDVTDISNPAKALTTQISYNITGSLIRTTDPANHFQTLAYNDSFSDGQNSRNTFAYPTTATDADGFSSYVQYNFDFAAVTRTQGPPPAGQSQGAIQTMTYDKAGRIQWINNVNNGAWKFFAYADRGDAVMSQETINAAPPSYWSITVVDGANRVRALSGDHPGSTGGYSAMFTYYDSMGRVDKRSNPTETTGGWAPAGDDQLAGWIYTYQTYDWQGRPLVTSNPDGTTKEASYGGCGCAGGQVVTMIDEGTLDGGVPKRREQKIYSDVLGRTVKTEVRNWQGGTPYSATVNTYDARDQITQVREYAGAEGSGTYQDTLMTYDGYGRLKTRHLPEQQIDPNNSASTDHTTWDYYADDTVHKITDARGAISTFDYNDRHLVTDIVYTLLPGVPTTGPSGVAPAAQTSYGYDAAGNRTLMTDGLGSVSYSYNQLSKMTSETRTFSGVGTFTLGYDYNLAGQLKSITDLSNSTVNYVLDSAGRVTSVTGTPYAGVSTYGSNFQYRAWGALKGFNYGNGRTVTNGYDSRLLLSSFEIAGQTQQGPPVLMKANYQYSADARIRFMDDTLDDRFDRAYAYDNDGRISKGLSGVEARAYLGLPAGDSAQGPYSQTYQHDVWGNLTGRTGQHWSQAKTFAASYTNNRRQGWTYDASGEVLSDDSRYLRHFVYDAAGEKTQAIEHQESGGGQTTHFATDQTLSQDYDGDGRRIRREERRVTTQSPPGTTQTFVKLTYYLRSSVLGGQVITELDSAGQKVKGYVYGVGGEVLAKQWAGYLYWQHTNPLTGTTTETSTEGYIYATGTGELDPLGNDFGRTDPYLEDELIGYTGTYSSAGNAFDESGGGCQWNGAPINCSILGFVLGTQQVSGIAVRHQGQEGGGFGMRFGLTRRWVNTDEGVTGTVRDEDGEVLHESGTRGPGGYFTWEFSSVGFFASQNSMFTEAVAATRQILQGNNSCSEFFGGAGSQALDHISKSVAAAGSNAFQPFPGNSATGIRMEIPSIVSPSSSPATAGGIYGAISPTSVRINTNGPFGRSTSTGGSSMPRVGGYNPGSLESRVLQLLHETAHLVVTDTTSTLMGVRVGNRKRFYQMSALNHLLELDGGDTPLSERNTERVLKVCRRQIEELRR